MWPIIHFLSCVEKASAGALLFHSFILTQCPPEQARADITMVQCWRLHLHCPRHCNYSLVPPGLAASEPIPSLPIPSLRLFLPLQQAAGLTQRLRSCVYTCD